MVLGEEGEEEWLRKLERFRNEGKMEEEEEDKERERMRSD